MKSNILTFARAALKKAAHRPSDGEKLMARFSNICPHAAAYAYEILPVLEKLHTRRRIANFDMAMKHNPDDLPRIIAVKIAITHYHLPQDFKGFTARQRQILRHLRHMDLQPETLLRPRHQAA